MSGNFKESCALAVRCLPASPYRDLLEALHRQMLDEIKAKRTPFAWCFQSDVGLLMSCDREWINKTHAVAGVGPIEPLFK